MTGIASSFLFLCRDRLQEGSQSTGWLLDGLFRQQEMPTLNSRKDEWGSFRDNSRKQHQNLPHHCQNRSMAFCLEKKEHLLLTSPGEK
jgi:hypothetical protein